MTTVLSIVCALGAAALFGVSSVLQQAAAQRETDVPLLGIRLLRQLSRRPRWLAAVALAVVSFGVQAIALAFGPLALVQPLAATDLLFALPFLAHRQQRRLRRGDWLAAGMVAGGIGGFLAASPPSEGSVAPGLAGWAWALGGAGAVVMVIVLVASRSEGTRRTALLAAAGAVTFAVVDALTKACVELVDERGVTALWSWQPYALLIAGMSGMVLAQGAYRSGSLLTSLPIIDTVEPVGAVLIGATVFDEHLGGSPALWSAQLLAAAVAVAGIVVLDRSPFVVSGRGRPPDPRSDPAQVVGPNDPSPRQPTGGG